MKSQLQKTPKQKRSHRELDKLSDSEVIKAEMLCNKAPAAYGNVSNLQKASFVFRMKVEIFQQNKNYLQKTYTTEDDFLVVPNKYQECHHMRKLRAIFGKSFQFSTIN